MEKIIKMLSMGISIFYIYKFFKYDLPEIKKQTEYKKLNAQPYINKNIY